LESWREELDLVARGKHIWDKDDEIMKQTQTQTQEEGLKIGKWRKHSSDEIRWLVV